jgi:hypothetical protein
MPIVSDTFAEAATGSPGIIRRLPSRAALQVAAALPRARSPATFPAPCRMLLVAPLPRRDRPL